MYPYRSVIECCHCSSWVDTGTLLSQVQMLQWKSTERGCQRRCATEEYTQICLAKELEATCISVSGSLADMFVPP